MRRRLIITALLPFLLGSDTGFNGSMLKLDMGPTSSSDMVVGTKATPSCGDPPGSPHVFLLADDLAQGESTAVTGWTGTGSGAISLSQDTGSIQPLYRTAGVNGLPSVQFDGVDDYLGTSGGFNLPPGAGDGMSMWVVLLRAGASSGDGDFISTADSYGAGGGTWCHWYADSSSERPESDCASSGGDVAPGSGGAIPLGSASLYYFESKASTGAEVELDGASVGTNTGANAIGSPTDNVFLGSWAFGAFQGHISAVLVYDYQEVSKADVETWATCRYGISI
ncbi:MAG: hypothetical protein ACPG6R_10975 [Aequoribacter sp.]|uniref:hypothetical protein n=1 Tax=Aequoribacter sp. TaxID=2847771 RepID=UPI003C5458F4